MDRKRTLNGHEMDTKWTRDGHPNLILLESLVFIQHTLQQQQQQQQQPNLFKKKWTLNGHKMDTLT